MFIVVSVVLVTQFSTFILQFGDLNLLVIGVFLNTVGLLSICTHRFSLGGH